METMTSEFTPRAYQIDLYEQAVENNIIVYLPTGAGKTYIAVMLLKKLSSEIQMYVYILREYFFLLISCALSSVFLFLVVDICLFWFYLSSYYISDVSLVFRSYSKSGKRSVFIVNTVALVRQQADYIRRHTCLTCKGYSGDMKVDFWKEDQWKLELDTNQVLMDVHSIKSPNFFMMGREQR